ncbi:MAG TPA: hypothetical protein DCY20_04785, partial [Firmicutes bacterium]|nr:hypothetical protein [Bacillota bacterium]
SLKKHTVTNDYVTNFTHHKKVKELKEQIKYYKENSKAYAAIEKQLNSQHDIKVIERLTTVFSAMVIVGLSAGLILMSKPVITTENFDNQMQANIEAAFNYEVTRQNTQNENIAYHTPHQFQYLTSRGVNDVIKYKDNQVIMHYNNQYNVIGQDIETYYLLREENKIAGEEIFYKNFNYNQNNGFVQLVKMDEKYLLTVFVDGTKLSSIIDYQEAPYMAYSMILMGKTVTPFESMYVSSEDASDATATDGANEVNENTES